MTKAEGVRRASRQLSFGYFADTLTSASVSRPECRGKVSATHLAWEKPVPAVRRALTDHLREDH